MHQTLQRNKDREITDKCLIFQSIWKIFPTTCHSMRFEKNFEYILISVHYNISKLQIFGAA